MSYQDTNLNGWDYVFAISEEMVNKGLKGLFEGGHLPKSFSRQQVFFGQLTVTIKGDFGCPTVHAISDGMKLCDLVLPIVNASMQYSLGIEPMKVDITRPIPAEAKAYLKITTSLSSIEAEILSSNKTLHDVYVDLKDEKAAFNLAISGVPKEVLTQDDVAFLETILKKEMQGYTGREYKVCGFILDAEADAFIPKLIDFSFIFNNQNQAGSTFLLCCAFDEKGPQVENRITFESKILPNNLPAAVWAGKQFVMGRFMQPMVSDSLKKKYPAANIIYDGDKTLKLVSPIGIGKPDGDHDAELQEFTCRISGGQIKIYVKTKIYSITVFDIDAIATVDGHIALAISADKTTFISSSGVDSHNVETDGPDTFLQIVLGILTGGIIPIIIAITAAIVKGEVDDAAGDGLNNQLNTATNVMNDSAAKIPVFENLKVNGHLLFEDIIIQDSGNVCIGIQNTQSA